MTHGKVANGFEPGRMHDMRKDARWLVLVGAFAWLGVIPGRSAGN
jgi:hypothetical protein